MLLALAGLSAGAGAVAQAAVFEETFAADPVAQGWRVHGDAALFQWNAAGQNLEVTWDSSRANSYFYRPLGTVLARDDDFSLAFDLQLQEVQAKNMFQVALGFIHLADATRPNFYRGTGMDSPNLVEFDYFPDTGYGATVSPTFISSNSGFATTFNWPLDLTLEQTFKVEMRYTAANQTLVTTMTRAGEAFGPISDVKLESSFSDFRVDAVAISSYSEAGQDPAWGGSILAHGRVDNLAVTVPPPPIAEVGCEFANGRWEVRFATRANWTYTLERTEDFKGWTTVTQASGTGEQVTLSDEQPQARQFYRVRAERP